MNMTLNEVVRVVVRCTPDGWRWIAQGGNWRVLDRSKRSYATFGKARAAASRRYPHADSVVEE